MLAKPIPDFLLYDCTKNGTLTKPIGRKYRTFIPDFILDMKIITASKARKVI